MYLVFVCNVSQVVVVGAVFLSIVVYVMQLLFCMHACLCFGVCVLANLLVCLEKED